MNVNYFTKLKELDEKLRESAEKNRERLFAPPSESTTLESAT